MLLRSYLKMREDPSFASENWRETLQKTAVPSSFLADELCAASSVCLSSASELNLQIVSRFWQACVLFCFLSSSDTFL